MRHSSASTRPRATAPPSSACAKAPSRASTWAAGDEVVGFSIVLGDGVRAESFFLDLVLARVGRAIALFSAFNIGSSLPEGPDVLDAVVGRLERAL